MEMAYIKKVQSNSCCCGIPNVSSSTWEWFVTCLLSKFQVKNKNKNKSERIWRRESKRAEFVNVGNELRLFSFLHACPQPIRVKKSEAFEVYYVLVCSSYISWWFLNHQH
jgi:hypothetical protein